VMFNMLQLLHTLGLKNIHEQGLWAESSKILYGRNTMGWCAAHRFARCCSRKCSHRAEEE
jgi:hypothetical protein